MTRFWAAAAVAAVLCVARSAGDEAADGSVSTVMKVVLPSQLEMNLKAGDVAPDGRLFHKDAMFGTPSRDNILGSVEYVTAEDKVDGCSPNYKVKGTSGNGASRIFLVDRGSCTFTTKARIAQSLGANGLIVVNNQCLNMRAKMWEPYPTEKAKVCTEDQASLPFMAYDNSGEDVTIPAFLIPAYEGQLIKDCLHQAAGEPGNVLLDKTACTKDAEVIINLVLDIPTLNKADFEIWHTSDKQMADFKTLSTVYEAFASHASGFSFSPRFLLYDAAAFGCNGGQCGPLCKYSADSSVGYCAVPAEHNSRASNGKEVVDENIRQMCIWHKHDDKLVWWRFMENYEQLQCASSGSGTLAECSAKAAKKTKGFDKKKVEQCEGNEADWKAWAAEDSRRMKDEAIFTTQFAVNNIRRDFSHRPSYIAKALCDSYEASKQPDLCKCTQTALTEDAFRKCLKKTCFGSDSKPFYCEQSNSCVADSASCVTDTSSSGGVGFGGVFFMLLFGLGIAGAGFFVYQRRARMQMQEEVRDILSEYMPLEELNSFSAPGGRGGNGFSRAPTNDDTVGVI